MNAIDPIYTKHKFVEVIKPKVLPYTHIPRHRVEPVVNGQVNPRHLNFHTSIVLITTKGRISSRYPKGISATITSFHVYEAETVQLCNSNSVQVV